MVAQERSGHFFRIRVLPSYSRLSDPVNIDERVVEECNVVFFSTRI